MLAAPPTSISWRRSSGRTRRVVARKHSKSASRIGGGMMVGFGMAVSEVRGKSSFAECLESTTLEP